KVEVLVDAPQVTALCMLYHIAKTLQVAGDIVIVYLCYFHIFPLQPCLKLSYIAVKTCDRGIAVIFLQQVFCKIILLQWYFVGCIFNNFFLPAAAGGCFAQVYLIHPY